MMLLFLLSFVAATVFVFGFVFESLTVQVFWVGLLSQTVLSLSLEAEANEVEVDVWLRMETTIQKDLVALIHESDLL